MLNYLYKVNGSVAARTSYNNGAAPATVVQVPRNSQTTRDMAPKMTDAGSPMKQVQATPESPRAVGGELVRDPEPTRP